jgi:hypothetical protein
VQGVIDEVVVEKASQRELSNLVLTGTTNTSGATIASGTCFVLNGDFVTAKADIASGATFTLNTNYEKKSVGSILTDMQANKIDGNAMVDLSAYTNNYYTFPCDGYVQLYFEGVFGQFYASVQIVGQGDGGYFFFGTNTDQATYASLQSKELFVRKGMRVKQLDTSEHAHTYFIPLAN